MQKTLKTLAVLEGLSFIALLGVAMPLKYVYAMPHATRYPGMVHGILFLAFIFYAHYVAETEIWPMRKRIAAFLAAVLPLGTFWFDWKYLKQK